MSLRLFGLAVCVTAFAARKHSSPAPQQSSGDVAGCGGRIWKPWTRPLAVKSGGLVHP
jgi:hypothetical protein